MAAGGGNNDDGGQKDDDADAADDEANDAFEVFLSYAKELDELRKWDLENKGLTKKSLGKLSDAFQSEKFIRLEELILNRNESLSDRSRSSGVIRARRRLISHRRRWKDFSEWRDTSKSQDAGNFGYIFGRGEHICTRGGVKRKV